jgi:5-methylcytosine-specific restriction endonuclease McrA
MIKWGKNNPDKIKENQHKWSKKHPEYFIKWCAEHIEQRQEYARKWNENHREQQWYANHPEQRKESSRRYRQTLKGKINDANNRHRRRVRKKGGKITLDEWTTIKQQQGFRCYWCKQKFEDKELTMDHVIPLNKGGLHDEGNIVAACRSCNLSKHAQIWSLV